jgi:glycosyltransferase involved in cell wall biosynthesis
MKINITAPDIHDGDAVGNHCLALALDFTEQGYSCELFAQRETSAKQTVYPLAELARRHKRNDILFVSHSIYNPQLSQILNLPGRKIAYFHGITPPELLLEHDPVAAYYCARGYAQLYLLAKCEHVVANSVFNLNELQKHIPGGFALCRTSVVPPISPRFALFKRAVKGRHQKPVLANQPLRLLAVGRVVPHKRIEDIIEVVALLVQQGYDAHLDIVGSSQNPEYKGILNQVIERHCLRSQVHMHGMVSDADLAGYYEAADVLVVASMHEGFCVPVLEAMYLGLPVVLRSGTAASEVAGEAGFIYLCNHEATMHVRSLLQEPTKRNQKVKAGLERSLQLLESCRILKTIVDNTY